jgi:carbonic anhydrase
MGRFVAGRRRPIVAKFVHYQDKEKVRLAALGAMRGDDNKGYGVNEQFHQEINEQRKALYPFYKAPKRQGEKVLSHVINYT